MVRVFVFMWIPRSKVSDSVFLLPVFSPALLSLFLTCPWLLPPLVLSIPLPIFVMSRPVDSSARKVRYVEVEVFGYNYAPWFEATWT